jgi:regulatory protein
MNKQSPTKTPQTAAMNTAVRILAHRDHSKYELRQKLKQKGFEGAVIDKVISKCERLNYINDKRTAQVYIAQLKRKSFGKRHIRFALRKKGLTGEAIEQILVESCSEIDERENASRILHKKMKAFNRVEGAKKRRDKIFRFLNSRGFSETVIADLIRFYSPIDH